MRMQGIHVKFEYREGITVKEYFCSHVTVQVRVSCPFVYRHLPKDQVQVKENEKLSIHACLFSVTMDKQMLR